LKAHHPVAFMAAMLSSEMSSKDNVAKYIRECREMEIPVLPPDVNESTWSFSAVGEAIRFGLGAVKGVGEGAVEAILETRQEAGRFTSLTHFATSVELQALNSKVFDSLIKAGAFDSFGAPRRALIRVLDSVLAHAQRRQREIAQGQGTLFGGNELSEPEPDAALEPWPERERLRFEKEALGFYLTGNPLSEYREQLEALSCKTIGQLEGNSDRKVTVAGVVSGVRQSKIKSGRNAGRIMGRFLLEDLEGSLPVAVFADQFEVFGALLQEDSMVLVKGVARDRGSGLEMTVDEVVSLDRAREDLVTELEVELDGGMSSGTLVALRELLIEHAGDVPVRFRVAVNGKAVRIAPPDRFRVRYERELVESIEAIVGRGKVRRLGIGVEN
jgi:DNA polymerase-3 subunit alpha